MKKFSLTLCIFLACLHPVWACICRDLGEIKSKEDLKTYNFVALVKIGQMQDSSYIHYGQTKLTFTAIVTILELFKGEKNQLKVSIGSRGTSCDMGVRKEETWVIFGNYRNGFITTHYCTHSFMYKNGLGELDWIYEQGMEKFDNLCKIYQITPQEQPKPTNGKYQEFYPNGKIAIESEYKNGLLEGKKTVYYATGELYGEEYFKQGKRHGKSVWYNRKQQQKEKEFYYKKGLPIGECLRYDFDGTISNKYIYNSKGIFLKHENYSGGFLSSVYEINAKTKERATTGYYAKKELVFDEKGDMVTKTHEWKGDKIEYITCLDSLHREVYAIRYDKEGHVERKSVYEYTGDNHILKIYNAHNILYHLFITNTKDNKLILEQEFDPKTGKLIKEKKY